MRQIQLLVNSNIYISLAAVFLTIESQIQLGMRPRFYPYLLLIFFATLFKYNLHPLITVLITKKALSSDKYKWIEENLLGFYVLILSSVIGFIGVCFYAKREVLIVLAPIAMLTLFYSTPIFKNKKSIFCLREVPYLKIFLIAIIWSTSTILLPVIHSDRTFDKIHVILMLAERLCFIFAITIPFDTRDVEADRQSGLKTIPLLFKEDKSFFISYLALLIFFVISFFHYQMQKQFFITWAFSISTVITFGFLGIRKWRALPYYHYVMLDGTMLLQGLLVILFVFYYK